MYILCIYIIYMYYVNSRISSTYLVVTKHGRDCLIIHSKSSKLLYVDILQQTSVCGGGLLDSPSRVLHEPSAGLCAQPAFQTAIDSDWLTAIVAHPKGGAFVTIAP